MDEATRTILTETRNDRYSLHLIARGALGSLLTKTATLANKHPLSLILYQVLSVAMSALIALSYPTVLNRTLKRQSQRASEDAPDERRRAKIRNASDSSRSGVRDQSRIEPYRSTIRASRWRKRVSIDTRSALSRKLFSPASICAMR
ncbi:hypothetical protein AXG89_26750 (plasmid) [Burkholderia sp. PAMC 26561]|nr:hypothetical protein AXG89_25940 [Burkholderia sp. PAMC 26561]AME27520.1 hypothetical protein AXG89_26750 [Burkholderia sp. PAMC 26561]